MTATAARRAPSDNLDYICELSPAQAGMLFHTLRAPDSTVYRIQYVVTLDGEVDADALEAAWQAAIQRHSLLRTAFHWEGLEKPLQVAYRTVRFQFDRHDWSHLTAAQAGPAVDDFARADRMKGFDLSNAPAMRGSLIRLPEGRHALVWTFHHLILDGWSLALVFRDTLDAYGAIRAGREPRLAPAPPYREYIAWLQNQDLAGAQTYWRSALRGFHAPTPLNLQPADTTPSEGDEEVGKEEARLSPEVTGRLTALAKAHKVPLNTIVVAAWGLVLAGRCDDDDVVFGVTSSGRPADLPMVEEMVGVFINTLPLRLRIPSGTTFAEWLGEVHRKLADLQEHAHTPLLQAHSWSEAPRGRSLFDSHVVFENYPFEPAAAAASELRITDVTSFEQTNYPVTLIVAPGGELGLRLLYDRTRVAPDAARGLLGAYRTVLEGIADAPDRPPEHIGMVGEAELRATAAEWSGPARPVPERTVHELFEEAAARTPEAPAVACAGEQITYGELNRRANRLARVLRRRGVRAGTPVGIHLPCSIETLVAILAVLKAGGAYVPLDPAYPAARRRLIVENADLAVLLSGPDLPADIDRTSTQVLGMEEMDLRPGAEDDANLGASSCADDLAYVLYTSGSQGTPKGVAMPHRPLANLLSWQSTQEEAGRGRTLQWASLSFDVSFQEIFSTWHAGGCLVLVPEGTRRDPERLLDVIDAERITRCFLPFVALQSLVETAVRTDRTPTSLRAVITAGEQLQVTPALRAFFTGLPECVLHNQYGPTESHVVTARVLDAPPERWPALPPIGRPVSNTRIYVLDRHLRPVPPYVPGELFIAGPALARGYLHRPGLTAERFLPDPFHPGERMYRTGDAARRRSGGEIEFLGRLDDQVKIRGFRVEPGEVATVLAGHPAVREAVVVAVPTDSGHRRLAGYVVAGGAPPQAADLRSFLSERLPDFMVPSAFVFVPELPRTPSGKVDRRALPAPEEARTEPDPGHVPPRTPLEAALADVWGRVLGTHPVGVHDDFFDLGGDSLLGLRVVARCRDEGIGLTVQQLFDNPTIARLARLHEAAPAQSVPLQEVGR